MSENLEMSESKSKITGPLDSESVLESETAPAEAPLFGDASVKFFSFDNVMSYEVVRKVTVHDKRLGQRQLRL